MSSQPRFTVLTPTYNRAHTLPRLYASIRRQTVRDFEWIIVDDGSTDGTDALVRRWSEEAERGRFAGLVGLCVDTGVLRADPFPEDIPGHVPESVVWLANGYHSDIESVARRADIRPPKLKNTEAAYLGSIVTLESVTWRRFARLGLVFN